MTTLTRTDWRAQAPIGIDQCTAYICYFLRRHPRTGTFCTTRENLGTRQVGTLSAELRPEFV